MTPPTMFSNVSLALISEKLNSTTNSKVIYHISNLINVLQFMILDLQNTVLSRKIILECNCETKCLHPYPTNFLLGLLW